MFFRKAGEKRVNISSLLTIIMSTSPFHDANAARACFHVHFLFSSCTRAIRRRFCVEKSCEMFFIILFYTRACAIITLQKAKLLNYTGARRFCGKKTSGIFFFIYDPTDIRVKYTRAASDYARRRRRWRSRVHKCLRAGRTAVVPARRVYRDHGNNSKHGVTRRVVFYLFLLVFVGFYRSFPIGACSTTCDPRPRCETRRGQPDVGSRVFPEGPCA